LVLAIGLGLKACRPWPWGPGLGLGLALSRVPTPPGKFWKVLDFPLKFPGPGMSWKMSLVLEFKV